MEPIILDGKAYADEVCESLRKFVSERVNQQKIGNKVRPTLLIVSTGYDQASKTYVQNKINRCIQIGINVEHRHYHDLLESDLETLCSDKYPTIFQLPITSNDVSIESKLKKYFQYPISDVDGFVAYENLAKLYSGDTRPVNVPCTAKGIMRLLQHYNIEISGKVACVIGRSDIVGRPVARLLEREGATVIQCHSKTPHETLMKMIESSDIIISATGVPNLITTYSLVNDRPRGTRVDLSDKVIVDVGINRGDDGKLCGDISESVKKMARAYTPIPGGIGPVTVAMLMENVVESWKKTMGYL